MTAHFAEKSELAKSQQIGWRLANAGFAVRSALRLLTPVVVWVLTATTAGAQGIPVAPGQSDAGGLPILTVNLSLQGALSLARVRSVSLLQSRADADSAAAGAAAAKAQTLPGLSTTTYASAGDSSNIVSSAPGAFPQNTMQVQPRGFADQNITLMAPLFTGGRLSALAASALRLSSAALLDERALEIDVRRAVADAYVDALLKQALIDAANSRLDAEQEQVRITQARVATGAAAPVDLLREQAELADANQAKAAAENDAAQSILVLDSSLGVSPLSALTLTDSLASLAASESSREMPASEIDAMKQAEAERPEVTAAEKEVRAAMDAARAAKGEYAPQVYGVGMVDEMAPDGGPSRAGYTVGLAATLPLYDGGQRRADQNGALAKVRRAQADALAVSQDVMKRAASAWLTVQFAKTQVSAATAGLTAAQKDFTLADLRYNSGKSTAANRLDALAALTRAQGDLATAEATLVTADTDLRSAIGAG